MKTQHYDSFEVPSDLWKGNSMSWALIWQYWPENGLVGVLYQNSSILQSLNKQEKLVKFLFLPRIKLAKLYQKYTLKKVWKVQKWLPVKLNLKI